MRSDLVPPGTHARAVRRKAVNLSLNTDLVTRAKGLTRNLSATVEDLLAVFVEQEEARQRAADELLNAVIFALDEVHEKHGLLSDDFPSL
jgi:antitoxin CcdA